MGLRVGTYRALFVVNVERHVVTISAIGHRRNVYGR